ncbi:MAG: DUF3310 domain-containing protein [Candidatus Nanopelagicales bacterium]
MNGWEPATEAPIAPSTSFASAREDAVEAKPKKVRVKPVNDPVNNPAHYTAGGIETIEYIKAKLTAEEFIGYLKGNVIKYTSRAGKKQDTIQDLEKAQWYMNRQIKELKGEVK